MFHCNISAVNKTFFKKKIHAAENQHSHFKLEPGLDHRKKRLANDSQLCQFSFATQKNSRLHSVALKFSPLSVMLFSLSVQNDRIVVLL